MIDNQSIVVPSLGQWDIGTEVYGLVYKQSCFTDAYIDIPFSRWDIATVVNELVYLQPYVTSACVEIDFSRWDIATEVNDLVYLQSCFTSMRILTLLSVDENIKALMLLSIFLRMLKIYEINFSCILFDS